MKQTLFETPSMFKNTLHAVQFLLLAFLAISSQVFAQEPTSEIELNWKLAKDDTIFYRTMIEDVGDASFDWDTEGMFDGIFGDSIDIPEIDPSNIQKELMESMKKMTLTTDFVTFLSNSPDFEDVLDIELVALEKKAEDIDMDEVDDLIERDVVDDIADLMASMMKGTMLRGSIYKSGPIHSFWVKSRQKNLISLLFELPDGKFKKGDSWSLNNVNFIGNDQNFRCKKAEQHNNITLTDIKTVDGETIAVIEYDLYEYVLGSFSPLSIVSDNESEKETMMKFVFKAKAEFSVSKGKWVSYVGLMKIESSGYMNSNQTQKFALVEK